jgi:DNA-binding transcriptional LysR family regulator
MDFVALHVFKTVVDEGGINPAAKKLHRVQSNVTTRIQRLETSLGTQLFFREKRRLVLSPAGKMFLEYAEKILALSEQARDSVLGGAPRGTLRLGTLESTAASRLPALLSRYHGRYPDVRVELSTGTSDNLVRQVQRRELEAAFVADPLETPALTVTPVFPEELVLAAPRDHPPIRRALDVHIDTLITFPAGCAYRRRLQAWLDADGITPKKTLELASYHAIVACVASGTGVAIVPRSVLETLRCAEQLAIHRLPRTIGRVITALVRMKGAQSSAVEALVAELPRAGSPAGETMEEPRRRGRRSAS